MVEVPEGALDLVSDETRAFAVLATVMKDGSLQATPVWFDMEDGLVRVNTARGRVKDKSLHARRPLALCILDPDDPYRYLMLRGEVVDETEEGAMEHINQLSWKYRGEEKFTGYRGTPRVIYKIRPMSWYHKP